MKRFILLYIIACVAIACDTGDIYPEEFNYESRTLTVNITFSNGVETIPNKREGSTYQYDRKLSLLTYEDGSSTPSVVTVLQRDNFTDGTQGSVTINYAPQSKVELVLAITLNSNDVIYTYDSQSVSAGSEDIEVNWGSVNLVKYARVQEQIYDQLCLTCHGTTDGSAGLNLSSSYSYNATVNASSVTTDNIKYLIEPSDVDNSILYRRLYDTTISYSHLALPYANDLELLVSWIVDGATN